MWRSVLGASCVLAGSFVVQQRSRISAGHVEETATAEHVSPTLGNAMERAQKVAVTFKEKTGAPGISVGVSHRGRVVWQNAYGFADVENAVPMTVNSVTRIASISKPICSLLALRLIDSGKLDVDALVREYVPEMPVKRVDGQEAVMRVWHVLSHTSGIRHYKTKEQVDKEKNEKKEEKEDGKRKENTEKRKEKKNGKENSGKEEGKGKENHREFDMREYYITQHYDSVLDSLALFKDDSLFHMPGKGFTYSSHGFTLVSAIIERAAGEKFETQLRRLLAGMGMHDTHMEEHAPLTPSRARQYQRDKTGRLCNAPYVDNSYKWAGGGLLSNVPDLLRFGGQLLDVVWGRGDAVVSRVTLERAWTPVPETKMPWFGKEAGLDGQYGLGWGLLSTGGRRYVLHTGGAIGGTSVLLLLPEHDLCVVILVNVQDAGGIAMASKRIADAFVEVLDDATEPRLMK